MCLSQEYRRLCGGWIEPPRALEFDRARTKGAKRAHKLACLSEDENTMVAAINHHHDALAVDGQTLGGFDLPCVGGMIA